VFVSGDIYISTDRVLNNSATFEQNYSDEMVRVISHGLLHLLKYNDKGSDEILMMRKMESEMLAKYNAIH
jgi:probable rRNA maturation factor